MGVISSFTIHNNFMRSIDTLLSPFYKWGNRDTERLYNKQAAELKFEPESLASEATLLTTIRYSFRLKRWWDLEWYFLILIYVQSWSYIDRYSWCTVGAWGHSSGPAGPGSVIMGYEEPGWVGFPSFFHLVDNTLTWPLWPPGSMFVDCFFILKESQDWG